MRLLFDDIISVKPYSPDEVINFCTGLKIMIFKKDCQMITLVGTFQPHTISHTTLYHPARKNNPKYFL